MFFFNRSNKNIRRPPGYYMHDLGFRLAVFIVWLIISLITLVVTVATGNSWTVFLIMFQASASVFIFVNSSKKTVIRNFLIFAAFSALVFVMFAVIGSRCPGFLDSLSRSADAGDILGLPAGLGAGALCQLLFYPLMKKRRFCTPVTAVCLEVLTESGKFLSTEKDPGRLEALNSGSWHGYAWLEFEYGGRKYLFETQRLRSFYLPDIGDTVELLINKDDPLDLRYASLASEVRLSAGLFGAIVFLVTTGAYIAVTLQLSALN